MASERAATALRITLVLSFVVMSAAVIRSTLTNRNAGFEEEVGHVVVERWERFAVGDRRIGPTDAAVVVVVFGDYLCPFCRDLEPQLERVRALRSQDVALVYKHLPLTGIHPAAYRIARMVDCATEQGRFLEAHRYAYSIEEPWEADASRIAQLLGITADDAFVSCFEQEAPRGSIEQDLSDARELGIRKTPTLMLNGVILARTPSELLLLDMINSEIGAR